MIAGTGRRRLIAAATALIAVAVAPASASASFPGSNGVVAYAKSGGGTFGDIYTVNPDGSGSKPLTNTADDDSGPSFSADGERIAFLRLTDTPVPVPEIWVMNADGSGQTRLLTGTAANYVSDPSFSPDGSTIAFTRNDGATSTTNVWAMNADGSAVRPLTNVTAPMDVQDPTYSPDGSKIAATYNSAGFQRIAVMNADGSGLEGVSSPTPNGQSQPDWSPDGTKIIYREFSRQIRQMDANGLNVVPLTASAGPPYDSTPVFSPQGTQFAFNRQMNTDGEVRLGSAGSNLGNTTTLIASSGGAGAAGSLSWQALNPPACASGATTSPKSGKSVSISVSCSNENAQVTVTGTGKAPKPKPGRGGKGGKGKAVPFTIPPITAEVPAGGSTDVVVPLPKKPAKAVKKGKKAKATLQITFTDGLGATTTTSANVVFKAKKKRGK